MFIQGQRVLNNFDVFAAVGHDRAMTRSFTTTVTNRSLKIRFVALKDMALVSGIVIQEKPGVAYWA